MLIVALVLAVISLAALVTAVVTSNELIAWVCIGFSALGVLLLIADAVRDRNRRPVRSPADAALATETTEVMAPVGQYPDDDERADDERADDERAEDEYSEDEQIEDEQADYTVEDYPDETVYDDPEHDLPDDDEPSYPIAAEEAAIHTVSDEELAAQHDSDVIESTVATAVELDESGSYTVVYSGGAVADQSSDAVADEPSYIVSESPTVSYADDSADDSIVVIYSSEDSEEERGGER